MIYGIIPISIRRNVNISDKAKIIYSEITASMNENQFCSCTNKYFADIFNVSETAVSRYIKELADHEAICIDVHGNERKITIPEKMVVYEKSEKKERKQPKLRTDLANTVVGLWNELLGTKIKVTRDLINSVTSRSKSFSDEEILEALRNRFEFVNASKWHSEPENARHRNNIYLVIRSDKDIQKYLGEIPSVDKSGNNIRLMKFD